MQGHPDDWLVVADSFRALSEPKSIDDYTILCHTSRKDLTVEVLFLLKDGWILFGTPYALYDGENEKHYHFQAMVKYA